VSAFAVRLAAPALADLDRLSDHLVDRARTHEDLAAAERARDAILDALTNLERAPFIHRKAGHNPFLRELVIPFGHSGYVALFEIEDATTVTVLAVRHQLEDDYH
jgi:plasmid stabilization system protein ParE